MSEMPHNLFVYILEDRLFGFGSLLHVGAECQDVTNGPMKLPNIRYLLPNDA
jgi:hypothetical protein